LAHFELSNFCTQHVQATCIAVKFGGILTTVAAIYSPPKHKITVIEYSELFQHLGQRWIAAGDWNAKHEYWGSRSATTKGRHLYTAARNSNAISVSNGYPTHWPTDMNKRPDCIDFFLVKCIAIDYMTVQNHSNLSSDHSPIVLQLNSTIVEKSPKIRLTNKHTDWDMFM
jgi:hypothetical protein